MKYYYYKLIHVKKNEQKSKGNVTHIKVSRKCKSFWQKKIKSQLSLRNCDKVSDLIRSIKQYYRIVIKNIS